MTADAAPFEFDNSYARDLEGFYVDWHADTFPQPALLKLNRNLAAEMGLDPTMLDGPAGLALFTGSDLPEGARPLAQAYAGHQFGGFSPQLGDGRALLLGEVIDRRGNRRDIQLKGSGQTPFSRGGDGKAVIGPVLREYLIGEAMHGLGIPTTRALAAVATGEMIQRERLLPGAVLTRVAASHLRVGTFQFFAARQETDKVRQLADYAIARHYPAVASTSAPYLGLLEAVTAAQAELVARWMQVGFIHGVMNTDNMTLSGETIDYGPCAFMDRYDPSTVFSSIDQGGRYAYANQPAIAQWNLARLAETLLPHIDPNTDAAVEQATAVITGFSAQYHAVWQDGMAAKLGLKATRAQDGDLISGFLQLLYDQRADFTASFHALSAALGEDDNPLRAELTDADAAQDWLQNWRHRVQQEDDLAAVSARLDKANPVYIPRNHQVEKALAAAEAGDLGPFETLLDVVAHPFDVSPGYDEYTAPPPPDTGPYRTYCGT